MITRGSAEGWQRNVWALALSVFIAFVGFQFFSPFLPRYVRELGVTDPATTALWSGLIAAITPAPFLCGGHADRRCVAMPSADCHAPGRTMSSGAKRIVLMTAHPDDADIMASGEPVTTVCRVEESGPGALK